MKAANNDNFNELANYCFLRVVQTFFASVDLECVYRFTRIYLGMKGDTENEAVYYSSTYDRPAATMAINVLTIKLLSHDQGQLYS